MRGCFKKIFISVFFVVTNICFSEGLLDRVLNYENIARFFDFENVENSPSFEQNLIQLLNEQLKLESGQNLWKAFLHLHETCREKFTFKFTFEMNDSFGANVCLDKCTNDPNNTKKKIFYFKIICNDMFSEKVFSKEEILEKNMLYRPCLIKLNGKYHLREQKLPFFITLAHEFLHALNQLERIQYIAIQMAPEHFESISVSVPSNICNTIDSVLLIQTFLEQKLEKVQDNLCLKEKYKKLWQNNNNDDSLDEMTVILGSERKIDKSNNVFIGETTFLREFYNNPKIISWSHDSAHAYGFYRERMNILLESQYVKSVLELFKLNSVELQNITKKKKAAK